MQISISGSGTTNICDLSPAFYIVVMIGLINCSNLGFLISQAINPPAITVRRSPQWRKMATHYILARSPWTEERASYTVRKGTTRSQVMTANYTGQRPPLLNFAYCMYQPAVFCGPAYSPAANDFFLSDLPEQIEMVFAKNVKLY